MSRILIIGSTSGIGYALAEQLVNRGHLVGGCARRLEILRDQKEKWGTHYFIEKLDLTEADSIEPALNSLKDQLGGMDVCIIASGISGKNRELDWEIERRVIETNVTGFSSCAIWAIHHFLDQGFGHLVGISSIAKNFGFINPAYNASKAFEHIYLQGLRFRFEKKGLQISTVLPGFVDTPMIEGQKRTFWVVPPRRAAQQIIYGIENGKRVIYISKRWKAVNMISALLPEFVLRKIL